MSTQELTTPCSQSSQFEISPEEFGKLTTREERRANIFALQSAIEHTEGAMTTEEAMVFVNTTHRFSDGVYAREVTIPKGFIVVGKIHKRINMTIISQGDVSVYDEDGYRRLKAPCTFVQRAGIKRVVYAHEDTVWTNVHGSHETDLEKLEEYLISPDYVAFDTFIREALLCHGQQSQ